MTDNGSGSLRGDVYGAAWERFLRYSPRTRTGAWLMAKSARNDLYRREQTQERIRRASPQEDSYEMDETIDGQSAADARAELFALVVEVADPADLEIVQGIVNGRRRPSSADLAAIERITISVKGRTNGRLEALRLRAFAE